MASETIDFELLLKKYIQYVDDVEGSNFITWQNINKQKPVDFTQDEWNELVRLDKENQKESFEEVRKQWDLLPKPKTFKERLAEEQKKQAMWSTLYGNIE
jgi:hypothetical protein